MYFNKKKPLNIAILSAMPEEIGKAEEKLVNKKYHNYGDLTIITGQWISGKANQKKINIYLAWSGWGKVSAARAATRIISESNKEDPVDMILFTGVAGSANPLNKQWDIILGEKVIQHDMDARPLFDQFVIPILKKKYLIANSSLTNFIYENLQNQIKSKNIESFKKIKRGIIATGDKFINDKKFLENLCNQIPKLDAVEMEGAAVAQVCEQESIPWVLIRIISDSADEAAPLNFNEFIKEYQNKSCEIIESIINCIAYF